MPSKKGYLTPEVIDPLIKRCVTFYIPDDLWWIAAFWGQMTALADTFMWEGTSAEKAEIVAVWEGVLQAARQSWEAGDCELGIEFRTVGGRIEYRPYPTAGWIDIGIACPCDDVIPAPEYNPDAVTTQELACNVATGIIEWSMTKYHDTLDVITAAATTVAAFDAILGIFPPAYIIADQILDAILEITNASVAVARAYDTVERREDFTEWLYCEMYDTGEMTETIWEAFKQAIIDDEFGVSSPGRGAILAYLKSFDYPAIEARSRIESYGSGNCIAFGCNTWEHVFDFVTENSQLGWVIEQGTFSSSRFNSAYLDIAPTDKREMVQIKRDWDGLVELTKVTVEGTMTGVPGGATTERRLRGVDGSTQKYEVFVASLPAIFTTGTQLVDQLNIRLTIQRTSTFSGADWTITKVTVEGLGLNPFL